MHLKSEFAGVLLDVTNTSERPLDANYASVTAPRLCYVEIAVDGEVFDGVWIGPGASHSWWTQAGGKLLPHQGLLPGQRLVIRSSDACALRVDWYE